MAKVRAAVWPYLLLSVALLGALSFGWYQTRLNRALARDAENKYMAAFHQLKWDSENIEERMARLMATNDPRQQENLLSDVRVFSAQAVMHMSTLPFGKGNTQHVTDFLNRLRERADALHDKVNSGSTLTEKDWNDLAALRKQSVAFESNLSSMLGLVGNNLVRWQDTARVTGRSRGAAGTTPIMESLARVDRALMPATPGASTAGVGGGRVGTSANTAANTAAAGGANAAAAAGAVPGAPPVPGQQTAMDPAAGPIPAPRMNLGPRVSPDRALAVINGFLDQPFQGTPRLTGQSDVDDRTGKLSLYFFDAVKQNGTPVHFGVSVHGGHVVYMLDGRPVTTRRYTREQLIARAKQWLARWGYPQVEFISAKDNSGTMMMDFAPIQKGVSIQTELIRVSLTMDNAEVAGFDARNYWVNHYDRKFSPPALSAAAAQQRLSPRLKVAGPPVLTVAADRRNRERLAWKFLGQYEDQRYQVFVDATTGEEVSVLRLTGTPGT